MPSLMTLSRLLILISGGAVGTLLRYFMSGFIQRSFAKPFPYGTLLVNLAGCFLIGIFAGVHAKSGLSEEAKLFLTAGFCGAFTTFSTFIFETADLASHAGIVPASVNIAASVAGGLILFFAGLFLVRTFYPAAL